MMKYRLLFKIFLGRKFGKSSNELVYKSNNTPIQKFGAGVIHTLKAKTYFMDHKIRNLCILMRRVLWDDLGLQRLKSFSSIYNEKECDSLNNFLLSTSNVCKAQFSSACYRVGNNTTLPVEESRIVNSCTAEISQESETAGCVSEKNTIKLNTNKYTFRSHTCGELNLFHVGKKVRLMGWLEFSRNDKFLLIRDAYGTTQLCFPDERDDLLKLFKDVTLESVIYAEGIVERRPPGQNNAKLSTGEIEIIVSDLKILSKALASLPFQIRDFNLPNETIRMQYRYLDLRQKFMQANLRFRSNLLHKIRCFLIENLNFVEVETPTLFRKTPGGAQEFVVPTVKKDKFYSLVQSPQQFKQLLMIGSIDRYFQIARCYRDEPGASDRQPEFTQLDIEMSFCEREDILNLVEDLLKYCWPKHLGSLTTPFPRMTYNEALNSYGTDKPDLRFNWKLKNLTNIFIEQKENCKGKYNIHELTQGEDFGAFAFVSPQGTAKFSNQLKKNILETISPLHPNVKYLFFPIKVIDNVRETLKTLFCPSVALSIEESTQFEKGDVLFLALGTREDALKALGKIRIYFAQILEENQIEVMEKNVFKFLWVLDFPLFEKNDANIESTHHPFTQAHPSDVSLLESDPLKVRGLHYDLVLNGNEIGGGSIRINDSELQKRILENILKTNTESLTHLLEGLASGAPPHGGIALGLDRLISILCGADSIRDVIAFPKGRSGNDPMSNAPSEISAEDRERYHLK